MEHQELWTLYQIDQQRITALDTVMVALRGWTVTLVAAIAGFALSRGEDTVLISGMAGAVLFGYLDMRYRRTQLLHARRTAELEQIIAPEFRLRSGPVVDPGLSTSSLFRYRSSLSFYAVILVLQATLWLVA